MRCLFLTRSRRSDRENKGSRHCLLQNFVSKHSRSIITAISLTRRQDVLICTLPLVFAYITLISSSNRKNGLCVAEVMQYEIVHYNIDWLRYYRIIYRFDIIPLNLVYPAVWWHVLHTLWHKTCYYTRGFLFIIMILLLIDSVVRP